MKHKIRKIWNRIQTDTNARGVFGTCVFALLMVLIILLPFHARNLTFQICFDEQVADETVLDWSILNEKAYNPSFEVRTYVCDGVSKFRMNPEYYMYDFFLLHQSELAEHVQKIELYSGNFSEKTDCIFSVSGDDIFEKTKDGLVLGKTASKKMMRAYRNTMPYKLKLIGILLGLYFVFMASILMQKTGAFSKFQRVAVCTIMLGTIAFCIFSYYNHSLVKEISGNNIKEKFYCIDNPQTQISQKFTAISNRLDGVLLYFKKAENARCGISIELYDLQTDELIKKDIISANDFKDNECSYDMLLDERVSNMGGEYEIKVRAFDTEGENIVFCSASSVDLDQYGQLLINGEPNGEDMVYEALYVRVDNMKFAYAVIIFLALLLIFAVLTLEIKSEQRKKLAILAVYAALLFFAVFKMAFYMQYVGQTPDESKHIAYVAYLEQEHVIIPQLKEMRGISSLSDNGRVELVKWSSGVNYLRHPPLYYHMANLLRPVSFQQDGTMVVKVWRMRLLSIFLVTLAIGIMFYIGYTRFDKSVPLHLLFGAVCISVPMLTYCSSGVSNDSLTVFTVTIFFLGLVRLVEHRWNALTFWLIAIGMTATLLTKATAGVVVVFAGASALLYYLVKEKCFKELLKPAFLSSIPVYFFAVLYYVMIYLQVGKFQPELKDIVSEQQFRESFFYTDFSERVFYTFGEYFNNFWKSFFQTWTGIASHVSMMKPPGTGVTIQTIGLLSLWVLPLICLTKLYRQKSRYMPAFVTMTIGVVGEMIFHFIHAYSGFCSRGYFGEFQSRYYLCAIVVFAFGMSLLAQSTIQLIDVRQKYGKMILNIINFGIVCFVAILFYEDFIYFLLNFTGYPFYYG